MGSDIAFCVEERHGDTWRLVPGIEYDDRNYELFAMLCGARNRFGFEPLDDWRGWPEGVSDETRKRLYDEAGSWFALPEWLASDLTRTVTAAYIWSPSTNPGELVLDPFVGSGTTTRVARACGRRAVGLDLYAGRNA